MFPTSRRSPRRTLAGPIVVALAVLAGCRTPGKELEAREDFVRGRYDQAASVLAELEADDSDNAHLWQMERSIVELARARPKEAVRALRKARERMVDADRYDPNGLFGLGGLARNVSATLADDLELAYAGRDYEELLLYSLLTLAELMGRGGDAHAYSLQYLEQQLEAQQEIADSTGELFQKIREYDGPAGDNPKRSYKLVPLGDYLRAVMLEESPTRASQARRAYERVLELAPHSDLAEAALERLTGEASTERNAATGERRGVVHVIALVGRGPFLEESVEPVVGELLELARTIWARNERRRVFPTFQQIRVPAIAFHAVQPAGVEVVLAGGDSVFSSVVTDVEGSALAEWEAMRGTVLLRAVLRRAFKLASTEVAKRELAGNDQGAALLADLGLALWTGFERVDTRIWGMLPATFQAVRLELPPGDHELRLRAVDVQGRPTGAEERIRLHVHPVYHSYVLAVFPTTKGPASAMTSDPARGEGVGESSAREEQGAVGASAGGE